MKTSFTRLLAIVVVLSNTLGVHAALEPLPFEDNFRTNSALADDETQTPCATEIRNMEQAMATHSEKIQLEVSAIAEDEQARMKEEDPAVPHARLLFEVDFKKTKIKIPTARVTMQNRDFVYKTPRVTMNVKQAAFDVPRTRMVLRKVGQYPQQKCEWRTGSGWPRMKFLHCTTVWKDIMAEVPEAYMERVTVSADIPEVTMQETKAVFSIPELRMTSEDLILRLPQFKYVGLDINGGVESGERKAEAERKARESEARINDAISKAQGDGKTSVVPVVNEFYTCLRNRETAVQTPLDSLYAASIAQISATITFLESQGGGSGEDAAKARLDLENLLAESRSRRQMHEQRITDFNAQEVKLINDLTSTPTRQLENSEAIEAGPVQ